MRGHTYMNVTTYRKNGEPVTTPVWFSLACGVVRFATAEGTGKFARILNNPHVLIGPASSNGNPKGEPVPGIARVLSSSESEGVERILKEKYGWQWNTLHFLSKVASRDYQFIEVTPAR